MSTFYKITDSDDQTYGGCQWGEGVTHEADGLGELCTEHWIHVTIDPLLGIFANPIQGNYDLETAHMWEGEGEPGRIGQMKVGCTRYTTLRRISMPQMILEQRIAAGILMSLEVYDRPAYVKWARGWLSGEDRSEWVAAAASAWAAAKMAPWEAWAEVATSAWPSAWAAAAEEAAAAAEAAEATLIKKPSIDMVAILHKAVEMFPASE